MPTLIRPQRVFLAMLLFLFTPVGGASDEGAKAQWVLINYWSEWCAPCRKEIPMLNALSRELAESPVRVAGVNFDDDPRAVTLAIAERLGVSFYTLTPEEVDALNLEAPDAMPTTYIVSPDGEMITALIGLQTREQILAQLSRLGLKIN